MTVRDNCDNGFLEDAKKTDVVYCDWATTLSATTVGALKFLVDSEGLHKPKVIVRARRFEIFSPKGMKAINWDMVDEVIFNTRFLRLLAYNIYGVKKFDNAHIIPNGIDVNEWTFKDHRHGDKIAMVGLFNQRKNLPLALHLFTLLGENYTLHLGGPFQCLATRLYVQQLIQLLALEQRVFIEDTSVDVDEYLEDKDYLLQTSISEGVSNIVMEAMAKGVKPLIHTGVGQQGIYLPELMFRNSREFTAAIESGSYDSERYRKFVKDNYNREDTLKAMDALL